MSEEQDINLGAITEALNSKMDLDHNNDNKPYLKTTYVNGSSGYNIWSNGYCEQWGKSTAGSGSMATINLLKIYNNTNYNINLAVNNNENNNTNFFVKIGQLNTSSFTARSGYSSGSAGAYAFWWKASGYLAKGEY